MFGRVYELQSFQQSPCYRWFKRLVQRSTCVRTQVVHYQCNPSGVREVVFHQCPHALCPLQRCMIIRDVYPAPSYERCIELNQVCNTIALILNIVTFNLSGLARQYRPHLLHTLHTGFIHAHDWIVRVEWPFVYIQHLLHCIDKRGILLRRDTPHFLTPRFKSVFLKPAVPIHAKSTRQLPIRPTDYSTYAKSIGTDRAVVHYTSARLSALRRPHRERAAFPARAACDQVRPPTLPLRTVVVTATQFFRKRLPCTQPRCRSGRDHDRPHRPTVIPGRGCDDRPPPYLCVPALPALAAPPRPNELHISFSYAHSTCCWTILRMHFNISRNQFEAVLGGSKRAGFLANLPPPIARKPLICLQSAKPGGRRGRFCAKVFSHTVRACVRARVECFIPCPFCPFGPL